jgi:hypothetical protein
MTPRPYQVFVRAFAERGGPCAVGVVVGQLHADGDRPNLHALAPLVLDTTAVQGATLLGLLHGMERLRDRPGPVVLHTNDANVHGFLRGTMVPSAHPELVERIRRAMGDRTEVVLVTNAQRDLCMGWAMQVAEAGHRSRRRAA